MNDKEDRSRLNALRAECLELLNRLSNEFPGLSAKKEKIRKTNTGGFLVWCGTFELERATVDLGLYLERFIRFADDPTGGQRHTWFGVCCDSPNLARQIATELEELFSPTVLRQRVVRSGGFSHLKNPVPLEFADRVMREKWSDGIFIGIYERSIPHTKSELKRLTARISDFWSHVMSAVRSVEDDDEQNDFEKALKGQGFGGSPAERRAVEDCAVAAARKHFEGKGFQFQKSFRTGPYDLEFTKGKTILHVEVKGTTTDGKSVILTRGEVDYHRNRLKGSSGLFVLHSIKLRKDKASGGLKHIRYPWNLKQEEREKLSPICYTYVV